MDNNITDEQWKILEKIMPEAGKLEKKLRPDLYGLVRRTIIKEHEQEVEAISVYRCDDPESIKQLITGLIFYTDEEINQQVAELMLSQEEAELEISHWALNHQSIKGELLESEVLVPFKLIRLFKYTYLLICKDHHPEAVKAFNLAFGREYGAFSEKALYINQDNWCGWAWFTDPDQGRNNDAQMQLKEIWGRMSKP